MALKMFGCSCFPLLGPYDQLKLQLKSSQCVNLGASPTHKDHKYLNREGKQFISKDVKFDEVGFPFSKIFPTIHDHKLTDILSSHTNVLSEGKL